MDSSNTDPFWNHVVKMDDGSMKCEFCDRTFPKGTSISRIKWHLSGEKGRGVAICGKVPKDVREAAFLAMHGGNKRQKTIASSSNVNDNAISSCPQEENNEVNHLTGDAGRIPMAAVQGITAQGVGEGINSSPAEVGNHIENMDGEMTDIFGDFIVDAQETREEAPQTPDLWPVFSPYSIDGLPLFDAPESGQRIGQVLEQSNGVDNLAGDGGRIIEVQGMEQGAGEERSSSQLEAAFLAMRGGNKRQKTIPSSSNVNDNAISSCPQEGNNEVNHPVGDAGRIQMEQGTEQGVGEGRSTSRAEGNLMENIAGEMMHNDRSITAEGLIVDARETRGEPAQAPDMVGRVIGGSWDEINTFLMKDDRENVTGGLTQPAVGASSSGGLLHPVVGAGSARGLTHNICETRGDALPTSSTNPVGEAFEENKNVILSWLMNDKVSSIGIYGMGGVGKTTLLKHIYNQLLERPDASRNVYWVTVSREFNINRLQNLIAQCLDLDLSNENDELRRAVKLSKELKKKQKWVLILDDLWNSFGLDKVGIPGPVEGCKLILTTRSLEVCRRMNCIKKIKVKVLSDGEAWNLFMEKLRHDVILSPEVEKIAESVMKECAVLPLGIITMAGSMRGVDDPHEWRNTLEKLKQSKARDMEDEVFGVLKYSYDSLNDFALQQCLLYCALFPEDYEIPREDLIGYLIDEGVIEGMNRRRAEFDEGHTMLNKLENVCLLEGCRSDRFGERAVKMHDLIRDMAHQILQTKSLVLFNQELPDVDKWKEDLVRVFCGWGWFEEIPSSHSPRCPRISTLLLGYNPNLTSIADSFFKELHGLKVLDLSYTSIKNLPVSVSDLTSLTGLLLKDCENLRHVPSLEKLTILKRLDLSRTALKKMPRGLECLSNLRYLRLNVRGVKEFPSGTLSKLLNLQVLILEDGLKPGLVKGKQVACLKKLETLECHFEGPSDLVDYLKSRVKIQSPSTYKIFVGKFDDDIAWDEGIYTSSMNKSVWLGHLCIDRVKDFQARFPTDVQRLTIWCCNDARSLCDVSSLIKYATKLERIEIRGCDRMENLVSFDWFYSAPPPSPSNGIFSSLKKLYFGRCRSMKKLFPAVLLPNLVNLEDVGVYGCEQMEEIIARDEEGVTGEEISLPKLKSLRLEDLPELKSICSAKLICDSLQQIEVWKCQKLKRMPICLPLLDKEQPSPPPSLKCFFIRPREWWETVVEWEHKDVLPPFVQFLPTS